MITKKLFVLISLILANMCVFAQDLSIRSFTMLKNDLSARTDARLDLNNDPCALVKVDMTIPNATFPGSVGESEYKVNTYWVYFPKGTKRMKIQTPSFHSLNITFSDYQIPYLQSNVTYELIVDGVVPEVEGLKKQNMNFVVNDVPFTMVFVEGGVYDMWSMRMNRVTLSDYFIADTEVTQKLWNAVMGNNPSFHKKEKDAPVDNVSWHDCQTFIVKLNQLTGAHFRLPTEAEWEFAAKGGNKSSKYQYSGSNTLNDVAWYKGNSKNKTHTVATKACNELGIFDMTGNVWEWCSDWFSSSFSLNRTDPTGPSTGTERVYRGGSYAADEKTSAFNTRAHFPPSQKNISLGLRLAMSFE